MNLYDSQGRRLYLTADERRAFIGSAATADRPVRTLCMVLHDTGCQISEALTLERIDLSGQAVVFGSLTAVFRTTLMICFGVSSTLGVRGSEFTDGLGCVWKPVRRPRIRLTRGRHHPLRSSPD